MNDAHDYSLLDDPLAIAAIVAMLIVGAVVVVDIINDGEIEGAVLALFASVMGPLVPALIARTRRRNGSS
jgi:hypothetical protein